jgi:ElaB/YqjD/DUF883 family membrane-anchored ribosome-binding protein
MTGLLSLDAAVEMLDAGDQAADAPGNDVEVKDEAAADTPAGAADDDEISADATAAEDGADPDDGATDTETEGAEPETPAIDPPDWWSAEHKARFAELPADLQHIVLEQERTRVSATGKAMQEAAEVRKKAEAEVQKASEITQALGQWLPQAIETFKSRWDNVDWAAWAESDPQAAIAAKFQYDAEQAELQRISTAKQEADKLQRRRQVEAEAERLKIVAPALADPKDGPKRREELASYLRTQGATEEQLTDISADVAAIAYKAMLWDRAQAGLKAPPPRKPAPKAVKPSAQPPSDTPQRETQRLRNRFRQTGSIDDAVALLNSQGT